MEDEASNAKLFCEDQLKKRSLQGSILFAQLAGSSAYNLNMPSSDKDYWGIYCQSLDKLLGLQPGTDSIDAHNPDVQMYEVKKYIEILAKGNHKAVEPLFTDKLCWISKEFSKFRELRHLAINKYFGFALEKMGGVKKFPFKNYYQAKRMLNETDRLLAGKGPLVFLEGEEREAIMRIRRQEVDLESLENECEEQFQKLHAIKSAIPEKLDLRQFSDCLVELRKAQFRALERESGSKETKSVGDNVDLLEKAERKLRESGVEGTILAVIESGSVGHHFAEGEPDLLAVYASSTSSTLSLFPPPPQLSEPPLGDQYVKGVALFEVQHCLKLLQRGCTRALELLYSSSRSYKTEQWLALQTAVPVPLLSSYNSCVGLSKAQLPAAKQGDWTALYHATQLLTLAGQLIAGSPLQWGSEWVRTVYKRQCSVEEALAWIEATTAGLPKKPSLPRLDFSPASAWLTELRLDLFASEC